MGTDEVTQYEVLAVRYGTRVGPKSHDFYRFQVYGEPDGPLRMDYFFWVLRCGRRIVLVDTGFDREVGIRRGRTSLQEPAEALARLGIRPDDIGHIVLTHMHYDHVGNVGLFPEATFSMARRELDFWTGPYARRTQFASSVEFDEIDRVRELERDERLILLDGDGTILPGVRGWCVGGHTPGQLIIEVDTRAGPAILASDSLHFYEEMELDRPFAVFADLEGCYRAYDRLKDLASHPGNAVVAGHDPAVMERFEPLGGDSAGLAVRIA